MSRFRDALLRVFGVALMLSAVLFAAAKAPDRPLESLVARWAPRPSDFVQMGEQLVHLRDVGPREDPQPIVLLHGTGASLHTWEGWVRGLERAGRRVITVDLPGFGLTGPRADGDYRIQADVAFVSSLLDHLQLPRVVLGGNSLGGEIAWELALAQPQRVAGLILVDAAGHAFAPESVPIGFYIARIPVLRDIARFVLPRRLVEESLRESYGQPGRLSREVIDRYFELTLREGNRAALIQRIQQLRPGARAEHIQALTLPTLILWGGRDRLHPPAQGDAFAREIKGSRLVRFDDLGHVPHEEDPALTLAPVLEFLAALPR